MEEMKEKARDVAELLKSIANENRLLILCELVQCPQSVGALQERLGISQSGISQHLAVLKSAGILEYDKRGQSVIYRIDDQRIYQVMALLKTLYCS